MDLAHYKLQILVGVTVIVVGVVVVLVAVYALGDGGENERNEPAPVQEPETVEKKLEKAVKSINDSTAAQVDRIVKNLSDDQKAHLRQSTPQDSNVKKAKNMLLLFEKAQPMGEANHTLAQNEDVVKGLSESLQKELDEYKGDDPNVKKAKDIYNLLEAVKPLNVANRTPSRRETLADSLPADTKDKIRNYTGNDDSIKKAKSLLDVLNAKSKFSHLVDFATLTKEEVGKIKETMELYPDHFENSDNMEFRNKVASLKTARADVFAPTTLKPRETLNDKPDEFKDLKAIKLDDAGKGLNNLQAFIDSKKNLTDALDLVRAQAGAISLEKLRLLVDAANVLLPAQSNIHAVYLKFPPKLKDMAEEKIETVEARYKSDWGLGWENIPKDMGLATSDRVAVALLTNKPEDDGTYQLYFKLLISGKVLYIYDNEFRTSNPKGNLSDCPKFNVTVTKTGDKVTRKVAMVN